MLKLIGILLILWELLADYIRPILESRFGQFGLSIYGIVLLYSRMREKAIERILEARVKALEDGKRWNGDTRKLYVPDRMNLKRLFRLLLPATDRGRRRKRRMKTNWTTLLIALLGALKLVLEPFGIKLEQDNINAIVDGAAAVVTVAGVIYHHIKQSKGDNTNVTGQNQSTFSDHGPMV